jgi:hypothetical protein
MDMHFFAQIPIETLVASMLAVMAPGARARAGRHWPARQIVIVETHADRYWIYS